MRRNAWWILLLLLAACPTTPKEPADARTPHPVPSAEGTDPHDHDDMAAVRRLRMEGIAQLEAEKWPEAEEAFRRALAHNSKLWHSHYGLAQAIAQQWAEEGDPCDKRWEEAHLHVREVLALKPSFTTNVEMDPLLKPVQFPGGPGACKK